MEEENAKKFPIFIALIIGAFVLLFILVLWKFGSRGILTVFQYFLVFAFILAIIGLLIGGFFWLFKKHQKQMVFIMKKSIIRTCAINSNGYHQELFTKGAKPFSGVRLGSILGFAMIKSGIKKAYTPEGGLIELDKPKDIIFVAFSNGGKLKTWLNGYSVFAGIYPDDFANDLNSYRVLIEDEGYSVAPELFRLIWCAKHWRKKEVIEETAKETIYRYVVEDNLNDIKAVIDQAVLVNPKDESKSLAEQIGVAKKGTGIEEVN